MDFSTASVKEISLNEAREFMSTREWLPNALGNASRAFGLLFGDKLGAVECFGHPGSDAILNICGREHRDKVAWLARGARARWAPKNAGSYLIARACKLMPPKCIFLASADSNANEVGAVYQAAGWVYVGLSSSDRMFKRPSHPKRKARSYRVLVKGPIRSRTGRVDTPDADGRRFFLIGGKRYYKGDVLLDGSRIAGSDAYPHILRKSEKARLKEVLAEGYVEVKGNPKHLYCGIYGNRKLKRTLLAALTRKPLPYPKRKLYSRRRTQGGIMENDKVLTTLREEAQRLERRLRAIRGAITGLSGSHGAASASNQHPAAPVKKRKLSAETRAKLSAAAKKRWGKKA